MSVFGVFGWPPDYGRHGPDCYPGAIGFMQPDLFQSRISKQIAPGIFFRCSLILNLSLGFVCNHSAELGFKLCEFLRFLGFGKVMI